MIGFESPGPGNTEAALDALEAALDRTGVTQVVVASTRGGTGLAAARRLAARGLRLVVVTHNVGFKEPGAVEMPAETRRELEELGARVHTGTMPLRSIGTAIRERQGYSQQDLVANTLRIFGQGIKVCVEIALMAADSGLVTPDDLLAVAGTGRGADTVVLLKPASSNRLFDLKVREIVAKPLDF
ncbi:hypothetical protein G3N55_03425 [Dissulfurirhabdus thermomarina]|uniref:Pyruvate kinase C-terminal domain-containing protein n=1 Tax=Dissulfurirhabdus thermomarina TaxID=1765737 RepID=A0A6N9TLH8_DISTH|nr:hypothetical protein [Dissulfurirhabdus thermomarina]NDY41898.1 hypothetical protein [Dissulfurirhabdus thermomarina]NMX23714.1 hypothetical protein [Dissulfurirhabdus thermomarina]